MFNTFFGTIRTAARLSHEGNFQIAKNGGIQMNTLTFLLICMGTMSAMATDEPASLEGIYTESRTMINEEGQETQFLPYDHAVLELQGDRFKFWHFSDRLGFRQFPISGKFALKGESLELESDKLEQWERRYVVTTIKGVTGIWPEKELQNWKDGKSPIMVPMLVRVADGPSGKELDQTAFKFPSVTALLDKDAAKEYWMEQRKKHDARYTEVPEPLRSLLREQSSQDDHDRAGYKKLILAQQQELDPILIKQLLAETGSGVSIVVGPMVLKDLFGCGDMFSDAPAFAKEDRTKRAVLQTLVNAIPEANNSHCLNGALLVFLRTTGLKEIDLTCSNGVQIMLKWEEGRTTHKTYEFSETVAAECERWANERLIELFGAEDPK